MDTPCLLTIVYHRTTYMLMDLLKEKYNADDDSAKVQSTKFIQKMKAEFAYLKFHEAKDMKVLELKIQILKSNLETVKRELEKEKLMLAEASKKLKMAVKENNTLWKRLQESQRAYKREIQEKESLSKRKESIVHQEKPSPCSLVVSCSVCLEPYGGSIFPRSGSCGHSICTSCFIRLPNDRCPVCREEEGFKKTSKNYLAKEILQGLNIHFEMEVENPEKKQHSCRYCTPGDFSESESDSDSDDNVDDEMDDSEPLTLGEIQARYIDRY